MIEIERSTLLAKEAAEYLGISYWLILELAKQKKIPHTRAGKRVIFRKESLDKWMDQQEELNSSGNANEENVTHGILRKIET